MGTSQSAEFPKVGYHVLQVQPNSPGEKAGLVAFFDFIVAAQGIPMSQEDSPFVEVLKTNVEKEVKLIVYNTKSEKTRETLITPSDSWGGSGLAGISIRFCSFDHATEQVWHVLDVYPDSPASAAGLEARTDYIVGTPELLLSDSEDFFSLIGGNEGKSIPLYVYSTNTDSIKLVHIIPNSRWGGTGSLGCDIGYGYLHRIPMNRNIPQGPIPIPGRPHPVPQVSTPLQYSPSQLPTNSPPFTSSTLPTRTNYTTPTTLLPSPTVGTTSNTFQTSPIMQPFNPSFTLLQSNPPAFQNSSSPVQSTLQPTLLPSTDQ